MSVESFEEKVRSAGHRVLVWANGPGYEYGCRAHPYRKILQCRRGSIVFHFPERDVTLSMGGEMVLEPGVEHSATVWPSGVACVEAQVS